MPQESTYKGKSIPIYGMVIGNNNYEILAENKFGFVIKLLFKDSEETISMYVFESNDSFYGYSLDTEDYGQPGHREYFKRITLPKSVKWNQEKCYDL